MAPAASAPMMATRPMPSEGGPPPVAGNSDGPNAGEASGVGDTTGVEVGVVVGVGVGVGTAPPDSQAPMSQAAP